MAQAKILSRLVSQLVAKGHDRQSAHAIAVSALQKSGNLHAGSTKPTAKGVARGNMTPAERAIDRASRYSGNPPATYKYSRATNRATKRP